MACTEARRPLAYYSFGDDTLRNDLINMYNMLSMHNVTVGMLCIKILSFVGYIIDLFKKVISV